MKLNIDCVREILLTIEKLGYEEQLNFDMLHERIPAYSKEDLHYCLIKLDEANLLDIITVPVVRQHLPGIKSIHYLTVSGHEFLENVKSDKVWNRTKSVASKVGSFSLDTLKDISVKVISELIKTSL